MARNDRFLKACRRESVDCTPLWIMRQVGRYAEEYGILPATLMANVEFLVESVPTHGRGLS